MSRALLPATVVSGYTAALVVVRALGEVGVPVTVLHYDRRDMAQASRYAVADASVPHPLYDETAFVAALVAGARTLGGSVLIPATDEAIVAVSRNRAALASHYKVACTDWDVTERFIDKSQTYALADANGIPAPRTLCPRHEGDLESQAAAIGYPLLLKPTEGHRFYERFGRKMVRVTCIAELTSWFRQAVAAGLAVMIQEIIPGDDASVVNYNAYFWDGKPIAEFTARQLRKAPPSFGSPRVVHAECVPEVIEPGRNILAAIGFYGFACVEFKRDLRDGVYKLMEVNGRHNLSGLLAVRSGLNFPLLQYRHLADGVIGRVGATRDGLYWTDAFRDMGYSLTSVRTERYSPAQYVRPYARHHCDAIVDRHDPGPALARLGYVLANLPRLAAAAARR